MLLILNGAGGTLPAPVSILFVISTGLALDAICLAWKDKGYIVRTVLGTICALFFTIETVVHGFFGLYFSISDMIAATKNVTTVYGNEVSHGLVQGIGIFLLYMIPVITLFILHRIRPESKYSNKKISFAIAVLLAAILLHRVVAVTTGFGSYGSLYKDAYNFNEAAETFGLTESTLLSFFRSSGTASGEDDFVIMENADLQPSEATQAAETAAETLEQEESLEVAETESTANLAESSEAANTSVEQETQTPEPVIEYNVMNIVLPGEEVSSSAAKLSNYISSLAPSKKNAYTGLFKDKNLIMICAESYCDTFITPVLTPTLWRLSHNGFYFPEFYQPSWGGSTTTGELSMILGLDSNMGNDSMQRIANNNHYFSMGKQLQRLGYFSAAFHNGSHTFYRRDLTHENLGYDDYFACSGGLEQFTGHSYPSDSEMFEATIPYYINEDKFSIYYMTVTGHAPYLSSGAPVKEYYDKVDSMLGDEYAAKTKYYICYQMELEKSLSILVDALEKAGKADDTVIVLTSDHYPYGLGGGSAWGNDRNYINDLIKDSCALSWNQDQTGLIIWSGCLEHENKDMACEIDEPVLSLDILPTVSNLFGVEFDSRLLPGRDVFAGTMPLCYWNDLSWVTNEGKYDSHKRVFYPSEGYEPTEEEQAQYIDLINSLVNNKIKMSSSIMKLDYYDLIFSDKED